MTNQQDPRGSELLMPSEVAKMLCVNPKTVARWAKEGKLSHIKTPGGHRRYYMRDITKLLSGHELQTLYTPGTVARMFRVDPKTVTRWAKEDRMSCIMTPGGHRRYLSKEVSQLLGQLRRD
jgi:excisionase family DNA binding protein